MVRIDSDFTNTEDRGLPPEGENRVVVKSVYEKDSQKGEKMVVFEFGTSVGWTLYHYCMNTGTNRWMLKKTLEGITGVKQPKGPVRFDTDDLIGKILRVDVYHERYNGKMTAKVGDIIVEEGEAVKAEAEGENLPF